MSRQLLTQLRYHRGAGFLVTLALAGLLQAGATIPHTHVTATPGLFNQEHDLSYLAALGGITPLTQAVAAVAPVVVAAAVLAPLPPALTAEPGRHPDTRAPPLR